MKICLCKGYHFSYHTTGYHIGYHIGYCDRLTRQVRLNITTITTWMLTTRVAKRHIPRCLCQAGRRMPGRPGQLRAAWIRAAVWRRRRRRRAAALRRCPRAASAGAGRGCGAGAGRPAGMHGAPEPCAHHTVELWCRSRLGAACQARAASIGPGGMTN